MDEIGKVRILVIEKKLRRTDISYLIFSLIKSLVVQLKQIVRFSSVGVSTKRQIKHSLLASIIERKCYKWAQRVCRVCGMSVGLARFWSVVACCCRFCIDLTSPFSANWSACFTFSWWHNMKNGLGNPLLISSSMCLRQQYWRNRTLNLAWKIILPETLATNERLYRDYN